MDQIILVVFQIGESSSAYQHERSELPPLAHLFPHPLPQRRWETAKRKRPNRHLLLPGDGSSCFLTKESFPFTRIGDVFWPQPHCILGQSPQEHQLLLLWPPPPHSPPAQVSLLRRNKDPAHPVRLQKPQHCTPHASTEPHCPTTAWCCPLHCGMFPFSSST